MDDYAFATAEGLSNLNRIALDKHLKKYKRLKSQWVKQKRCPCVQEWIEWNKKQAKNSCGKTVFQCKHFTKHVQTECKDELNKMWNRIIAMAYTNDAVPEGCLDSMKNPIKSKRTHKLGYTSGIKGGIKDGKSNL